MKTKKNSAFTFAIISVYIITVLLYVVSLFVEYRRGEEKAASRFNDITRDVSRISLANTPRSQKFYDEILDSIGNVSDIAGIQLTYGNELIFSYPKDMKDLNNINSYLVATRTTKVFASNGIPVNIHASIYKLKPSSIFYKGRIAFIVILAATIVTAIYLILYIRNGVFPSEAENDDLDEADYPDVSTYDLTEEESSEINSQLSSLADSKEEEENSAEEAETDTEESTETEPEQEADATKADEEDVLAFLNEDKKDSAEENNVTEESSNSGETAENAESAPKGLFCPDTGFGWEEYMLTRLDSELLRSASSDQDLSLFSIRIPGIDWTSECGKSISKIILEKIKFNDLVFNYGTDGLSAIIQNQNTDQALVTAESLHAELAKVLKDAGSDLKIFIGISTRSLRLISGSRLANESIEALNRAIDDPDSPIIAFRVNPERYKDFLASASFQEEDRPAEKTEDEKLLESLPEPPADTTEATEPAEAAETEALAEEGTVKFDDLDDFDIEEELK